MLISYRSDGRSRSGGFTLLEVLIATVVTLILTALVVEMFAIVSDGIFNSRANIEVSDQLRNAKHRLIQDLRGVTAPTIPPLDPSLGAGYFEYVEGGNVANTIGGDTGATSNITTTEGNVTTTGSGTYTIYGDLDDILMFTTASFDDPFVGKLGSASITSTNVAGNMHRSRFAEVAWFARSVSGQPFATLHRCIFLVDPQTTLSSTVSITTGNVASPTDQYSEADMSGRQVGGIHEKLMQPSATTEYPRVVRNSLGELTMRERRALHQPNEWPYDMMYATQVSAGSVSYTVRGAMKWTNSFTPLMGLPTMMEYSRGTEVFPGPLDKEHLYRNGNIPSDTEVPSFQKPNITTNLTSTGSREAEDVILTNVVGFDVKAWDPGAPVFRAAPAADGNSAVVGLIVPGDGGYGGDGQTRGTSKFFKGALANFIENPSRVENQPVAFGAYVDLNYMWLNRQSGEVNVTGPNSQMTKYFTALTWFTRDAKVVRNDGAGVRLPRPSFAFALPGRVLSGYPVYTSGKNKGRPNHTVSGYQLPAVWDTWSRHYEYDGINNDGDRDSNNDPIIDEGTDGLDNNNNGYIDEPPVAMDLSSPADGVIDGTELLNAEGNGERDAPPPYDAPLRGIKVSIRVMEQDSRQVREVSTVHEFIPY